MKDILFIPEEKIQQVRDKADLLEVISDYVVCTEKGARLIGDCPVCGGKKKLEMPKAKKLYKCFSCGFGGKDPVAFLVEARQMKFQEAVATIAQKYNISIEPDPDQNGSTRKKRATGSFRDAQLRESGIPPKAQKLLVRTGPDTEQEIDRYSTGTITSSWDISRQGDDMILHYVGLDRKVVMYREESGKKPRPYFRVRWQYPSQHRDRNGTEMKYQSPRKSGNHLWIPNSLITKLEAGATFDYLVICEGEKKADKLAIHEINAVGIPGIHNFSIYGEMVTQFETIIRKAQVKNIIFLLDADWRDISARQGKDVDIRPKTFASAISRFKDYFNAYASDGLYLDTYFGYHTQIMYKGIDDLLTTQLKGNEAKLKEDLEAAMLHREGKGQHLHLHKVTTANQYKIREYFNLHSNTAFFDTHRAKLAELRIFKFNGIGYRLNDDGEFEMDQKLMPYEQYWREETIQTKDGREKTIYNFDYVNMVQFLFNRGFGLYEHRPMSFLFIHIEGKIVRAVNAHYIQTYIKRFTQELENKPVLELLYRGGEQYLGEKKLANMNYKYPDFPDPDPDNQYFYFQDTYWKITRDEITTHPLSELPHHVWQDKIIEFTPTLLEMPLLVIEGKNHLEPIVNPELNKSDIVNFFLRTSCFYWRKEQILEKDEDTGAYYYTARDIPEKPTLDEVAEMHAHMITKILAAGYILTSYKDFSSMRAIICVDGKESEVGKAEGGTGKSLWSGMFEKLLPTHVIDAKAPNLTNDAFIYDGVTERTQCIVFDDCRVNIDFEFFFSQITRGITVNSKGEKKFKIDPVKMIFNTNNMLNGEGNSFERRQYTLAFSDYYNAYRTPKDDFQRQLFMEWDHTQWNYFYNFMAACVQAHMKYGLTITIPTDNVERRRLRQTMGEEFLEWAEIFFDKDGTYRNNEVEVSYALEKLHSECSGERKWTNRKRFKAKIRAYCEYTGLMYNPQRTGQQDIRIKKDGKEYICIADSEFNSITIQKIP